MPYKSKAQAAYFHIHKKELEKKGVDVDEWDKASKGKKLPKKVKKKYQFAGSTDPCGPGTQWDANSMQCVPVPTNPNVDPIFQNNYNGDFTDFNPSAFALGNGKVVSGDVVPINNPNAGATDARGNFVPYQQVVPDAIDKGFNYDNDNVYRKTVEHTNNNILGYTDPFKALNLGLNLTQGIAGIVNDAKTKKQEKYNLLKARYNRAYYNPYEQGLNNVPAYFKNGGSNIEINPKHKGLFTKEAKAAGMSVQEFAKHVLANKDKYSPAVVKRANFAKNFAHQNGGNITNTGYLNDSPDRNNPYNIIPSNNITMNNVSRDLLAIPNVGNPQIMPANSGKYKFPNATHVTEIPLAKNGGSFSIGSHVGWNSEAGHVTGTITKKHTKPFKVNGYTKHASKEKPVYEIKSSKTDHIAYHFGDALHKLQNGGYHDYDCPNGDCYDNAAIKLPIPEFLQGSPSKRFLRQAKRDEQRYIESGQYLIDRAGFYKNNTDYGKYPVTNWDPQPMKNGVIDYGVNNFTPTGSNAQLPSPKLYAQTGGYVTPQNMEDWNNFIKYAQQQGLAGSPKLDVRDQNLGQDLLNNYVKANPNTSLNYALVPKIQQELQYYRQQILDRISKGGGELANGATPENFMSGLSKVDGWLGSRTTSYSFPSAYMHNNNTNTTQALGLAATSNLQQGGKVNGFQYGGLDQVESQPQGNAEVEEGEVIQQNSGDIVKAAEGSGTHEEGGNIQPNVSRVLEDTADKRKDKSSKLLRITPTESLEITGFKPKGTVTHSKLFEQSTEFYNKKLHKFEKKLNDNLQYIKNNGGQYAENSLDQNLKLLSTFPTEAELFDKIYNHQEAVKNINGIMDNPDKKVGGFVPKFQNGSSRADAIKLDDPKGWEFVGQEGNKKYYRKKGTSEVKSFTDYDVVDTTHKAPFTVDDILNHPEKFKTFANNMEGSPEEVKRQAAEDLFYHGIMPRQYTKTITTPDQYGYMDLPAQPGVNNRPQVGTRYNTPGGISPSEFNMPLHWYDVAGNVANYLSSSERIPVSFEQLDREPLRVHELNPQPALDANTGDFNTALAELPNNGVGFANQANLLANKYKVNNEIVGQYANQNAVRADQIDAANNANKFQLDQINLNLRDRAVNQQLQGMEVERQSKLNAFDDYLTKLAQNAAFNRNGNLILQLTPYFNQEGKFNGNQYIFRDNGNGNAQILDKNTGKVVKTITQDGFGATKQIKTYIRQ